MAEPTGQHPVTLHLLGRRRPEHRCVWQVVSCPSSAGDQPGPSSYDQHVPELCCKLEERCSRWTSVSLNFFVLSSIHQHSNSDGTC
jgi:hypothetical protein